MSGVPTSTAVNRELFFTLIQNASFGVLLIDADFTLAQISRGATKAFSGIEPLLGRDFAEILRIIWPEPFASEAIGRFRHTLATGEPYHSPDTTEQRRNIQAVESYDWQIERVLLPEARYGVVGYFYETTHRVNAERDAYFLNDLTEQVRIASDPHMLAAAMAEMAARYLRLDRCFLAETDESLDRWWVLSDYHGDLPPMTGEYRVSDYPADLVNDLREGRNVVCEDGASDSRWPEFFATAFAPFGVRAYVAVPLRRDGRWLTTLVAASARPRSWSHREVALLGAVADRMWNALEKVRLDTSLRVSDQLLQESEQRFRQMAELTPQFIWVSRPDGSLEYVNQRWTEYSGLDFAATADFDRLAAAIHPEERVEMFARWARSVESGTPFELEARMRRHDGEWRWFVIRTLPLRDTDGRIVRWFGASSDVHDHKTAEAALRASEQRLRNAHAGLEERVRERTEELNRSHAALEKKLREERAAQARISTLVQQLVTIQEDERGRIAREIHDQLGQPVTALKMHVEALRMRNQSPSLEGPIASAAQLAADLDRSVDFLTWQLRPSVIDDLGLSEALANLVANWSQQFRIAASYECENAGDVRLPSDVETHLYRITQEALHNIYKHARARQVLVELRRREGRLLLRVADDGRGIQAGSHDFPSGGMGLSNMRERATLAGAELFVFWSQSGTTIEVRLPLPAAE